VNLFTSPLDKLTFPDIEAFLGLNLPEEKRIKENERIDYKEDVPEELGDWVAALANVAGGLIFIGIRSDKKKQNIPVAWNGVKSKADIETQIVAKISSTVRPTPEIKIGSASLDNGNVIVVIRVSEGVYPPYEYQQGAATKINIRVHDARKSANVRELEALFKRRGQGSVLSEQTVWNHLNATGFDCSDDRGGTTEFHRIVVVPAKPARIRLDSELEKKFKRDIGDAFRNETLLDFSDRKGEYVQFQKKRTSFPSSHRLWRLYESGALGSTGTLYGEFDGGKPVGDLAHNLMSMCRLAERVFGDNGISSTVYLGQLIRGRNIAFLPQFPEHLPLGKYYTTGAITVPDSIDGLPDRSWSFSTLDFSELGAPHEQIAEMLMRNLRELRQIVVDYPVFMSCIQQMRA
jgi:hypothetical protein